MSITPAAVNTDEGTSTILTVSLPNSIITANPLVVNYTISGSATSGADFTPLTGSVTIPGGSSSATITVAALSDSVIESNETVVVTGAITSGFTWSASANTSTVTIINIDDPANKVLSFSPITVSTAEGTATVITVSLPTGVVTSTALVVNYTVSGGTATSALDYRALSGTVTIAAGQNSAAITISALTDSVIESDETVILTGGSTPGFTWNVAANSATVTLTDTTGNNPANKVLSILPATVSVAEGATTNLTVSLPTGITIAEDLSVNYTVSGSAGISDFKPLSGTVIIPAGSGSAMINVEALNDGVIESPETIVLTGVATPGFTWGVRNVSTVTITDETGNNPANLLLSILPATINVAEGANASLVVSLPNGITTASSLVVNYTVGGTATKGSDFGNLSGSVTIPAGANSVSLDVAALNDLVIESDETIVITGGATRGFTWGSNNVSTVTITDETGNNPANKVLSISPATNSINEGSSADVTISLPSGITTGIAQSVNYIIGGTADNGSDYTTLTGTATIAAGTNSVTFSVRALTDRILESDETVELLGEATTGFTWDVFASEALVNIVDLEREDANNRIISISSGTAYLDEPSVILTASLPSGITASEDIYVNLDNKFSSYSDLSMNKFVIIPAGQNSAEFEVKVGTKRKNNEVVAITGTVNNVTFASKEYQFTLEPGKVTIKNDLIEVADAVSANGDGINDYFAIGNIEKYKDNAVSIIDRWGVEVYRAIGYDNQSVIFDGQYRGKELENGTYFYLITIVRKGVEHQYKGFVVLKR